MHLEVHVVQFCNNLKTKLLNFKVQYTKPQSKIHINILLKKKKMSNKLKKVLSAAQYIASVTYMKTVRSKYSIYS